MGNVGNCIFVKTTLLSKYNFTEIVECFYRKINVSFFQSVFFWNMDLIVFADQRYK